ncbi:MAG: T9SS type A sorting domain-containing protein [Bacteroidetes bacterium]|nr:T9SS type A sorting domain-containing protein [Bacteroidota bacterium]
MLKATIVVLLTAAVLLAAHPNYTAYSGAAGSKGTCASSCHGSGTGTIVVTGFPQTYIPGTSYPVTVKHSGGSTIANYNCTTRKGNTTAAGGTFTVVSNATLYSVSGYEAGVHAASNNTDSSRFIWNAPAAGSGAVSLYVSGSQGSKSGPNTKVVLTAAESPTAVGTEPVVPAAFTLEQNYPNPFNPATVIRFSIPRAGQVELTLNDLVGNKVRTLFSGPMERGAHSITVDLSDNGIHQPLASGVYFYTLRYGAQVLTRKLVYMK